MDWSSAQKYCRTKYVDLATITTDRENQRLMDTAAELNIARMWIGLKRTEPDSNEWQWSDGGATNFFKWGPNQPDNGGGSEDCVMMFTTGWNDLNCASDLSFYCSWKPVLVKEKKTWQEALEYCRKYHTNLAGPVFSEQLSLPENATVSVWTGLHFMNGQWVCVSGAPKWNLVLLPSCPDPRFRCGSLNTITRVWENRDCSENLYFLCY